MTIRFTCADQSDHDNVVEGGVDKFAVSGMLVSAVNTIHQNASASAKCIPSVFSNHSVLQLNLTGAVNECHVEIVNSIGQVIEDKKLNAGILNLEWGSNLQDGLYHLIVIANGSVIATTSAIKINE
jgi:hypothetical protein